MKNILLAASLLFAGSTFAQIKSPAPSPTAEIMQKIGLTEVEIEYSRPGMKDRKIFGDLVPYGKNWRLGANASTKIEFDAEVNFGGVAVPAGEYAMYAIPSESSWEIILSKDLGQFGADTYKAEDEVVRFVAETKQMKDTWETFTIEFSNFTTSGAHLIMGWENTAVHIPIETDAVAEVEKQIKSVLIDGPDARDYAAGARFYLDQKKDLKQAHEWITKACEMRPEAFWYMHNKAQIEAELGMKKEAIATATKSMEMAAANEEGDYGYVNNNKKLIAKLKAK